MIKSSVFMGDVGNISIDEEVAQSGPGTEAMPPTPSVRCRIIAAAAGPGAVAELIIDGPGMQCAGRATAGPGAIGPVRAAAVPVMDGLAAAPTALNPLAAVSEQARPTSRPPTSSTSESNNALPVTSITTTFLKKLLNQMLLNPQELSPTLSSFRSLLKTFLFPP